MTPQKPRRVVVTRSKTRRVVVTLEIETADTLDSLRSTANWDAIVNCYSGNCVTSNFSPNGPRNEVLQASANVIRAGKKGGRR